jgi:hypothetical protein
MADYPHWAYYPSRDEPPEWVSEFVGVVATAKPTIDSAQSQA